MTQSQTDQLNIYRIYGTCRKVGAIGKPQPFGRRVRAANPKDALEKNNQELYAQGFELILAKDIWIKDGKFWGRIPMLVALGLE